MAQKIVTTLIDDLDGGTAHETIDFALDGKQYEIDLSEGNASTLREILAQYASAARKAMGGSSRNARKVQGSPADDRQRNQAIREWAHANGMKVSERGRIPAEVIDAYQESRLTGNGKITQTISEKLAAKPVTSGTGDGTGTGSSTRPKATGDAYYRGQPPTGFANKREFNAEIRAWATATGRKVGPTPSNAVKQEWIDLYGQPEIG